MTRIILLVISILLSPHIVCAETGCASNKDRFVMKDLILSKGDFVAIATSSLTSKGIEKPLDTDGDGINEVAAVLSSGEVTLFEGVGFKYGDAGKEQTVVKEVRRIVSGVAGVTNFMFGDMDNDNLPDLVMATSNRVDVLFNDGKGGYALKISSATTEVAAMALADFNGDAQLDIVAVDGLSVKSIRGSSSRTRLNSWITAVGLGTNFLFTSPIELRVTFPSTKRLPGVAIGGHGDGFLLYSLIVVDSSSTVSAVRFSASMARSKAFPSSVSSIESVELTGDRLQDLVLVKSDAGEISLLQSTGAGYTELTSKRFSPKPLPYSHLTAVGDFSSAGRTNILVASPSDKSLKLFSVVNNKELVQIGSQTTVAQVSQLATPIDLDGDGDLDLIGSGDYQGSRYLMVIRNRNDLASCVDHSAPRVDAGGVDPS